MTRSSRSRRILFRLATSRGWERAVRAVPGAERRAYAAARRYVAGTERGEALAVARRLADEGLASSLDFFGEAERDLEQAAATADAYVDLALALAGLPADANVALDLSHLGVDIDPHVARGHLERIAAALPR